MGFFLAAALLMTAGADSPAYTLEPVGIEFTRLPEELCPLVEGVMTDESGAIAGQPNSLGYSFGCYYWALENPIANKHLWIREKLSSVLPPNFMETASIGETKWTEGSMNTAERGGRSLGLMPEINFTFFNSEGVLGRGRAYGIFRNDYAVLLTISGPSWDNPQFMLEEIISYAVLSE